MLLSCEHGLQLRQKMFVKSRCVPHIAVLATHHIYCPHKIEFLRNFHADVGGVCKLGKPGFIVAESTTPELLHRYVEAVMRLRWQKIVLQDAPRPTEEWRRLSSSSSSSTCESKLSDHDHARQDTTTLEQQQSRAFVDREGLIVFDETQSMEHFRQILMSRNVGAIAKAAERPFCATRIVGKY